jgi:hypothetical protein
MPIAPPVMKHTGFLPSTLLLYWYTTLRAEARSSDPPDPPDSSDDDENNDEVNDDELEAALLPPVGDEDLLSQCAGVDAFNKNTRPAEQVEAAMAFNNFQDQVLFSPFL